MFRLSSFNSWIALVSVLAQVGEDHGAVLLVAERVPHHFVQALQSAVQSVRPIVLIVQKKFKILPFSSGNIFLQSTFVTLSLIYFNFHTLVPTWARVYSLPSKVNLPLAILLATLPTTAPK